MPQYVAKDIPRLTRNSSIAVARAKAGVGLLINTVRFQRMVMYRFLKQAYREGNISDAVKLSQELRGIHDVWLRIVGWPLPGRARVGQRLSEDANLRVEPIDIELVPPGAIAKSQGLDYGVSPDPADDPDLREFSAEST